MITLRANHAQRRLAADRLSVVAAGLELEGSIWESTWIEPITQRLMLRPRPIESEWYTESTGSYAKFGLADFGPAGPEWEERQDQHWAGPWIAVKDSAVNPFLVTPDAMPANMGLFFAWFSYGGGDSFLQAQVGWGSSPESSTLQLDLFSDGRVSIIRDGDHIASGKISGGKSPEVRRLQVFELMMLPLAEKELLITGRSGDGFRAALRDIEGPAIPESPLWFRCPKGATQVQIAPVRFCESGFATSVKTSFLEPPGEDEEPEQFVNPEWAGGTAPYRIYGWAPEGATASAELTKWDGTTLFVPDGVASQLRARITLATTDALRSPVISAVQMAYPALPAATDDTAQTDLTGLVLDADLSVPAGFGGATLDVSLDADHLADVSVDLSGGQIPILLQIDGVVALDGWSEPCNETRGGASSNRTHLVVRDRWSALQSAVFADRVPLDGMRLVDAIRAIVGKSGIEYDRMSISETEQTIPISQGAAGTWAFIIESGDTAAEWLVRLLRTFLPHWYAGFRPRSDGSGEEFFALAPDDLPAEPAMILYASQSDALADGADPSDAWKLVCTSITQAKLAPSANEVRIVGFDPVLERPIVAVRTDYEAQRVALAAGSRPVNWAGSIQRFEVVDAGLTDPASVDDVCEKLFAEKCSVREFIQFECQLLQHPSGAPLWRGDLVRLTGIGDFRLISLGASFRFEVPGGIVRPALYVGEKVDV